jgi:hypothetical protein
MRHRVSALTAGRDCTPGDDTFGPCYPGSCWNEIGVGPAVEKAFSNAGLRRHLSLVGMRWPCSPGKPRRTATRSRDDGLQSAPRKRNCALLSPVRTSR